MKARGVRVRKRGQLRGGTIRRESKQTKGTPLVQEGGGTASGWFSLVRPSESVGTETRTGNRQRSV